MKNQGMTFLELLVVLLIICLLALTALPAINRLTQSLQTSSTSYALLDAINLARHTAVSRNQKVLVTPMLGVWKNGWDVFVDMDGNNVLSSDDTHLLRHSVNNSARITPAMTSSGAIVYHGSGASHTISGAFLAGTLRICPASSKDKGKAITIRFGGRVRITELSDQYCGI